MTLQVVLVALLGIGATVKAADYRRSIGTTRLLVGLVSAGLLALALGQVISFPVVTASVDMAAPGLGKLTYNALTIMGLCALLSFFIGVGRSPARVRPTVRRTLALGAVVALVLALLILVTPEPYRSHSLNSPHLNHPAVMAFYIVGNIFFVYVFLLGSYWTRRYGAKSEGALAAALSIVSVGLLALVVASAFRAFRVVEVVIVGDSLLWLNAVTFRLNNVGYILVAVGLSLAGVSRAIATWRWWRLRRQQYQDLAPLWSVLTDAYPEVVAQPRSGPGRARLPVAGVRQLFRRRLIEVRDGLLCLSPRLATVTDSAVSGDPDTTAAQILQALKVADVPSAETRAPVIVAAEDEIETLVAISQSIERQRRAPSRL
ncbi:hypothetical protein SAMN05216207_105212 [Pseudonocardia ammonioxydans]|uniref:DUF6545 domain-containing protein n=1 Tax=Pseudonocardia ammonioxydans TaxID=260086 RepID=A0A1I5GWP6_PSUAM|nr:MAB_1171c family putative transporter [Pseudonocardia ammonioxydans]SFO40432.1 hypothetical protein SAMN05216207_105212 [Pseudonocardia ammonioxydans]